MAGDLYIATGGGAYHIYLWRVGKISDIGTLPGYQDSNVRGLSDDGEVLGLALYDTVTEHRKQAFLWQNGVFSALPSLGGPRVDPNSINSRGVAVGASSFPGSGFSDHAVLWQRGQVFDLNGLIPPGSDLVLDAAFGINDQGWIVCEGMHANKPQGVLLIPDAPRAVKR